MSNHITTLDLSPETLRHDARRRRDEARRLKALDRRTRRLLREAETASHPAKLRLLDEAFAAVIEGMGIGQTIMERRGVSS